MVNPPRTVTVTFIDLSSCLCEYTPSPRDAGKSSFGKYQYISPGAELLRGHRGCYPHTERRGEHNRECPVAPWSTPWGRRRPYTPSEIVSRSTRDQSEIETPTQPVRSDACSSTMPQMGACACVSVRRGARRPHRMPARAPSMSPVCPPQQSKNGGRAGLNPWG